MATFENPPPPSDIHEGLPQAGLLALAYTPSHSPAVVLSDPSIQEPNPTFRESSTATPHSEDRASSPVTPSLPKDEDSPSLRKAPSRPSYSDYLESFRVASRNNDAGDTSLTLEPPQKRPTSASPDYSCLPKDKIQFILSLKEALKRHNTIPSSFNKLGFFEELYKLLADEVWQIRNESTLLILDLLPYLGTDLDACMSIVLPHLVPNLGEARVLLQRSTVQLLTAYIAVSKDKEGLVDDLVMYGINDDERQVSRQVTINLVHLFTDNLRQVDVTPLAQALLTKVHDPELRPAVVPTLLRLQEFVGRDTFTHYLGLVSADSREKLDQLLEDGGAGEGEPATNDDNDDVVVVSRPYAARPVPRPTREYGLVDAAIMDKIRHPRDWKTRAEGCEQLRVVIKSMTDVAPLLPHLPQFLQLLDSLFDDNNFRISLTVLDIFRLLLDLLHGDVLHTHLRQIVHAVMKHVGDSKVVVRIENMRVFQRLLQAASPAAVVPILCENLGHRSSRVREDCLNLIIYALMTFPSYEFDLGRLAEWVSWSVVDAKRRVRHAALECVAAIAQFLGPARLGPLMAAVDKVEDEEEAEGAMEAVQARLARRQLPRVSPDGLIEYSLVVPASSRHSSLATPKGADVNWVLAGSGGVASSSQGSGGPPSLSASFTASDSYVNTLAFTHPLSSPSPRCRNTLEDTLHRKRSFSDITLNKTEERGLALWTTDTIDLNRTAPSDLGGYRGVYLGKLRQGSSYSRGGTVEKGYSLLPNKYGGGGGSGGLGSARGDRPGSRSPSSIPRRINALAPLEQGDTLVVSRAASTRSVIPPLSAVSRRSIGHGHDLRHDPDSDNLDEEDDAKSDFYDDDEGEDAESEEEEVEEEVFVGEGGLISRPKSSATTRDSGISVFSGGNDGEAATENEKEEGGARGMVASSRSVHTKGSSSSSLSSADDHGRNSYEAAPRSRKKGESTSPSRRSLPDELHNTGFGIVGKGVSGGGFRSRTTPSSDKDFRNFEYESDFESDEEDGNIKLSNTTLTKMKLLKKKQENMKEIERRRQDRDNKKVQEERVRKYRQLELQHSQNSLQPSRANSGDSKLAIHPNLSYKGRDSHLHHSPQPSPRCSPTPSPVHFSRIPKSKSHNTNLSKSVGRVGVTTEKRHRSLDRNMNTQTNGIHPRETFRTPQLVKRGHPPVSFGGSGGGHLSSSVGTTTVNRRSVKRLPDKNQSRVEASNHPGLGGQTRAQRNRKPHVTPPDKSIPISGGIQRLTTKKERASVSRAEFRTTEVISTPVVSAGLRTAKPSSSCFKTHLEPFANPSEALKNAHGQLSTGDWESQVEGIEKLVRLTKHHQETLLGDLRNINFALMKQAKNLRSQVSRAAIQAFTYLFDTLKRNMEADSEKIATILLNRTVDTNKFLQLDSHHALDALVENITPTKSIPAIIQEGLGHRNPAVRTTVARLLTYEVERLGPSRVLSGQKDITDRILPAAAKLAQEGSLETRQYAKQIFQLLIQQGQFDAVLKKYVQPSEIRNLQKFLDNLTSEGRIIHDSARSKFTSGSRYTRTM